MSQTPEATPDCPFCGETTDVSVTAEIEGQDTLKELRMLFAAHGIGLIKLDVDNPSESQVLIPARERGEAPAVIARGDPKGPRSGRLVPEPVVISEEEALSTFAANSIVIGRTALYVPESEALSYVAGYCICNDISERAFQDLELLAEDGAGGQFQAVAGPEGAGVGAPAPLRAGFRRHHLPKRTMIEMGRA